MGNVHNGLLYNTLFVSQPVTLYASDGFLVKINNVNDTKFNSNKVDLFTSIVAKQNFIYNVPQPVHPMMSVRRDMPTDWPKNVTSG